MKSNTEAKMVGLFCIAAVGASLLNMVRVARKERKHREKILIDTEKSLHSMNIAARRVNDRIEAGVYDGKGFEAIRDDFEFETLIEFNKE